MIGQGCCDCGRKDQCCWYGVGKKQRCWDCFAYFYGNVNCESCSAIFSPERPDCTTECQACVTRQKAKSA